MSATLNEVTGKLLHSGYQYDDGLALDLYGDKYEGEHTVESIAVHGTKVEIGQLFRAKQLESMGYWLDLMGDYNPEVRRWAEHYKHQACSFKD
jgi:hypothetical protein